MRNFKPEFFFFLFTGLLVITIIARWSMPDLTKLYVEETEPEIILPSDPIIAFGLPIDSFKLDTGIVRRNESLSDILHRYDVSRATIHHLAQNSKKVFNVRRIKTGKPYYLLMDNDSAANPRFFVYQPDAINYYVFSLTDSLGVKAGKNEVTTRLTSTSGVISSSLWNALKDNDSNPNLANELSEIYAWTIDFFGIQKGDKFRILYEEKFVDGKSIGYGKIHAAWFEHINKEYFAFNYKQDNHEEFFDEKGQSLKKAFLKAPLRYSRISSRFSNSRLHPVLKIRRPHHGIDYAAPTGTPVVSIGDGVIIKRGYQKKGGGNYLKIRHNSVYTTVYMHLLKFGKGATSGKRVKQGQIIGYVGATGLATGPHLDFRVYRNGHAINPLRMKAPAAKPVKKENFAGYIQLKDSIKTELMNIPLQTLAAN